MRRIAVLLAIVLTAFAAVALLSPLPALTTFYLVREDGYVLAGLLGLLAATALPNSSSQAITFPQVRLSWRTVTLVAAVLAILLWAGTYLLLEDYPLTRDEHMVVFDMAVFRSGRLAAPLPVEWRAYAEALTPAFLLRLPGNAAWVSAYMPGNAMLRTAFAQVLDPALMNPLLAAVGAMATYDISRRLFPESVGAQLLALLLYLTSAQVLVTAMTSYAMTAHLALNLVWLSLYLRGTRAGHAGAIGLGFAGMGLHQVVFHPLFAAPFIDQLRRRGERRTAALYLLSYAAFGLFWLSYQHLVAVSVGISASSGAGSGTRGFLAERVIPLLVHRDPLMFELTAANLVRFVSWQNLALTPLMGLGFLAVRRNEGIARPLAWGILLTVAAMALLLPYQGHGWGYRYLHGLVGSCALLAAYGWRDFSGRGQTRALLAIGSAATIFGSLPFLLWQTHKFVDPYARVNRMIEGMHADMVVIETEGTAFAIDEVRNRPNLSNRPIRLAGNRLTPVDIAILCRRGSVAFVDVSQMHAMGLGAEEDASSSHFKALRRAVQDGTCARAS